MLLSLSLDNPISLIVSVFVVLFFVSDVLSGYKKGFLESTLKFLKSLLALLFAYLFRGLLSNYLMLNCPFINLGGLFKGLEIVNILIYEVIAFIIIFVAVLLILNIVFTLFKVEERLFRLIALIGVPNKVLGAVFGGLKSIIIMYFVLSGFFIASNFFKWDTGNSLADYVVNMPVLKNSFGNTLDSLDEISSLAVEYENTQDKGLANDEAIDILLEYGIITEEQLEVLIEAGKVEYSVNNADEQKEMMEDLYGAFIEE